MEKVLIYGDSNTWGDNFLTGKRITDDKQWVNILRRELKDKYIFLQEGLPGRLAGNDEEIKCYKNGKSTFISTFRTNAPVDVIIISLGTNDLQKKYNKKSKDIIKDLLWYKEELENSFNDLEDRQKYFNNKMPRIIYILPINFDYEKNAKEIFDKESELKREEIIKYFVEKNFDIITASDMSLFNDGIHLNYEGHEKMAALVKMELSHE